MNYWMSLIDVNSMGKMPNCLHVNKNYCWRSKYIFFTAVAKINLLEKFRFSYIDFSRKHNRLFPNKSETGGSRHKKFSETFLSKSFPRLFVKEFEG